MNKFKKAVYSILEIPFIYSLSQVLLTPGAKEKIEHEIQGVAKILPPQKMVLDVGCGPKSWLWSAGLHPIGLDYSHSYVEAFCKNGEKAVTASAEKLPFVTGAFDSVWSVFLFHHLNEEMTKTGINEMIRVCKPGGNIIILDIVMPKKAWQRPAAYLLRRYDRGEFVRREEGMLALLPKDRKWSCRRFSYSWSGAEVILLSTTK